MNRSECIKTRVGSLHRNYDRHHFGPALEKWLALFEDPLNRNVFGIAWSVEGDPRHRGVGTGVWH